MFSKLLKKNGMLTYEWQTRIWNWMNICHLFLYYHISLKKSKQNGEHTEHIQYVEQNAHGDSSAIVWPAFLCNRIDIVAFLMSY